MPAWLKAILILIALFAFLLYSPTLLEFKPTAYSIPFPDLQGPLEVNNKLSKAEHLFKGVLHGPESIVFHEGALYTGLEDGRIVKIKGSTITTVAQTGTYCKMPYEEHLCGRPLGMRIGKDGLLYVIDGYYGIFTMNFTTGVLTRVLPRTALIEGQKITFPDDLDIDDEGNIYFTDASSKWDLSMIYYLLTEYEGSGRVIKYNVNTGKSEVLVKNLYFPNGIQVSKDGNSILICELVKRRIMRYYIKGPKKGKLEVFADLLPAEPDNIRSSPRGYWVGLVSARNNATPTLMDRINSYPTLKKLWARFHHGVGTVLVALAEITSYEPFKEFAYKFKRGDTAIMFLPRHGIVLEFDESGKIINNLQDPEGNTSVLSQITEHEGYLYLGSFVNDYLGRLKL